MPKSSNWKKLRDWSAITLMIAVSLVGCSSGNLATNSTATDTTSSSTKPKVVASYSVLCDLAQEIAQDTVDLNCLIDPGQDPHSYQATPEARKGIDTAQLILYGGYQFEPAVIDLVKASNNSVPKVAVDEQAVPKPLMGEEHHHEEEAPANEEAGEEHAEEETAPDPHVWHDAENGIHMVEVIRDQMQKVAPNHQDLYARNAQQLIDELKQVDTWIQAQIDTIPTQQRKLVTTHDALAYYANAYNLKIEGALQGLSTEEQPTAARVRELAQEVKSAGVPTIFAEVTTSDRVIKTVAREANVKISDQKLYADGLGEKGSLAGSYSGMLTANTCAVVDGLGGQCNPFQAKRN